MNKYDTRFGQYLKNYSQSSNGIWPVNKYNVKKIFLKKLCSKWSKEISSKHFFCFFKRGLYEVKVSGQHLSFNSDRPQLGYKNKLFKILEC